MRDLYIDLYESRKTIQRAEEAAERDALSCVVSIKRESKAELERQAFWAEVDRRERLKTLVNTGGIADTKRSRLVLVTPNGSSPMPSRLEVAKHG